jgi:hypothetical protein
MQLSYTKYFSRSERLRFLTAQIVPLYQLLSYFFRMLLMDPPF